MNLDWAIRLKHYDFKNAAVVLASSKAAREFFEPILTERIQELTLVAFCDDGLRLVELLCFPGTTDSCDVSVREIANRALGCAGFILAHNHPSGSAEPSDADIKLTQRLYLLAEALDVELLDHLIFAGGSMSSFRQIGLI